MEPSNLQRRLGDAQKVLEDSYDVASLETKVAPLLARINAGDGKVVDFEQYGRLEAQISSLRTLQTRLRDSHDYLTMAIEEKDPEAIESAAEESMGLLNEARDLVLRKKFNQPYDNRPAIITVTGGAGGAMLIPFVDSLAQAYARFARRKSLTVKDLEVVDELQRVVTIEGEHAYAWFRGEAGTQRVQLLDFNSQRQTGYVGVEVEPIVPLQKTTLKEDDLRYEFLGAGGPGGQNANRTLTGVRITHVPTGLSASSRRRSQKDNIASAKSVLESRLELHLSKEKGSAKAELGRGGHHFRSYRLFGTTHINDTRSHISLDNADAFFQGHIEPFIYGFYGMKEF